METFKHLGEKLNAAATYTAELARAHPYPTAAAALFSLSYIVKHGMSRERARQLVQGRPVIVTGASRGVGRACAAELAKLGASPIFLIARDATALEKARLHVLETAEIHNGSRSSGSASKGVGESKQDEGKDKGNGVGNGGGCEVVCVPCDAADGAAVQAAFDGVIAERSCGRAPAAVVHCAGAGVWRFMHEISHSEIDTAVNAPYRAALHVTAAASRMFANELRGNNNNNSNDNNSNNNDNNSNSNDSNNNKSNDVSNKNSSNRFDGGNGGGSGNGAVTAALALCARLLRLAHLDIANPTNPANPLSIFFPARARHAVVLVQSPAGHTALAGATAYASARWALRGLHACLSADWALDPRVNSTEVVLAEVTDSNYFSANLGSQERIPGSSVLAGAVSSAEAGAEVVRALGLGGGAVAVPGVLAATLAANGCGALVQGFVAHLNVLTGPALKW